ncbi:NUDIX domain-containing protein [Vagococcus salmoninarum]|uniref:NUDIX domain-containing protein n=1 Tax=Vagococcus salmoninarum TaxID=2739 RepID=UPI003F9D75B2
MVKKQPQVGVGALLLNDRQEVLLVLRKKAPDANCWSLPGGKVEWLETIEQATIREIKEEINLEVQLEKLLCVTNHMLLEEDVHFVCPTFTATIVDGEVFNNEPDKLADIRWFSLADLPDNLTYTTSYPLSLLA